LLIEIIYGGLLTTRTASLEEECWSIQAIVLVFVFLTAGSIDPNLMTIIGLYTMLIISHVERSDGDLPRTYY